MTGQTKPMQAKPMQSKPIKVACALAISTLIAVTLPACSLFQPYKIDIQQGTPLTADKIAALKPGMTQQDVTYILGTPSIIDPLNPYVWQYSYMLKVGTDTSKTGVLSSKPQNLLLKFNQSNLLESISGAADFPASYPLIPIGSRKNTN